MLLGDFFVNMWYNKNDYEDQRMTIRIHDDVENNYVEHIKAGKNDYFSYNMTGGKKIYNRGRKSQFYVLCKLCRCENITADRVVSSL